jgi:hypothetical protein
MDSDIEEMRLELKTLADDQMVSSGIETCRTALISITTSMEVLNRKYDLFGLDLDGWSQSTFDGIERYDSVLEKLSRKYSKRVANIGPGMQLLLMLSFSGAQFCFNKSMIEAAMPNFRKVAADNPELVEKMKQSMKKSPVVDEDDPGPPPPPPRSSRFEEEEPFVRSEPSELSLSVASVSLGGIDDSMSVSTSPRPVRRVNVARGGRTVVRKGKDKVEINIDDWVFCFRIV